MKQYLLAGVAVLLVSAHASDNPFDLKENFGKLDQDQEMLLGDLKKIAEAQELAADQALEDDTTEEAVTDDVAPAEEVLEEVVADTELVPEKEAVANKEPVVEKEVMVRKVEAVPEVAPQASEEASSVTEARLDAMRQRALEASKQEAAKKVAKEEVTETKQTEADKEASEKAALLEAVKQKEAELKKAKEEQLKQLEAKKEAERREVEAYEKQRAEKLAKQKAAEQAAALEREALAQKEAKAKRMAKNNSLPNELIFFKRIIEAKTSGKHTPLKGELRKSLETIVKEKNNQNYTFSDMKKELERLKDSKEVGLMIMAYIMSKSVVLQESMDSNEIKKFDAKFQQDTFKKDNMEEIFEKYPNEIREIGFSLLEDILANGIPQLDFNMKMSATFSTNSSSSKEPTLEISASTIQNNTNDINVTREKIEAKLAADKAYEEAVKEMDQED